MDSAGDEEDEDDDEEGEDEVEEDLGVEAEGLGDQAAAELRRKRRAAKRRETQVANRALRIKMGKSGAQAASRRSIKKGKDACQRKLWNNAVSKEE